MWVPSKVVEWLNVSLNTVDTLKQELSAVKAERDAIKQELNVLKINFDWLRIQVNQLQHERSALLEKAYGIKTPVPEVAKTPKLALGVDQENFSFEDMGDEMAKKLGFPLFQA